MEVDSANTPETITAEHPMDGVLAFGSRKRTYVFRPLPDITTMELAQATELLLVGLAAVMRVGPWKMVDGAWEVMPENVRRHFATERRSGFVL